ncbi:hypothetical protein HY489_03840 [Candidatus Woesearchaeota archaeon]|nr:hypothetical protein [Candidatus Woesearchaeota archaeon]
MSLEQKLTKPEQQIYEKLARDKQIAARLNDPENVTLLERPVQKTYQKYESNLGTLSGYVNNALKGMGLAGDAYFLYDPVGGLGIKFLSFIGRTAVELPNLASYARKSRDLLGTALLLGAKAISYLPFLTLADIGVEGLARRRILKEAKKEYLDAIKPKQAPVYSTASS